MIKRIISTVALWAFLYAVFHFTGIVGGVFILALFSAATQWELYSLLEKMQFPVRKVIGTVLGSAVLLIPFLLEHYEKTNTPEAIKAHILAFSIIVLSLNVITRSEAKRMESFKSLMPTVFGILYIPFLLHFLIRIYEIAEQKIPEHEYMGVYLIIWLIAVSKFSDVGALLVGKMIGKTKLAPTLSPGKTIEGAVGGVVFSMLISMFGIGLMGASDIFPIWLAALLAIPIAITAIIGDLIESTFKRCAKSKDSGNLIPGIGGAFDLADSLILTSPLGFLLIQYCVL